MLNRHEYLHNGYTSSTSKDERFRYQMKLHFKLLPYFPLFSTLMLSYLYFTLPTYFCISLTITRPGKSKTLDRYPAKGTSHSVISGWRLVTEVGGGIQAAAPRCYISLLAEAPQNSNSSADMSPTSALTLS